MNKAKLKKEANIPSEVQSLSKDEVEGTYKVYMLRTSSNTLYIGQTNDLEKRIKEHKNKTAKSAKYIKYFSSFSLVYSETYPTRTEAMRREWQLKKWSKAKKEALINNELTILKRLSRASRGKKKP